MGRAMSGNSTNLEVAFGFVIMPSHRRRFDHIFNLGQTSTSGWLTWVIPRPFCQCATTTVCTKSRRRYYVGQNPPWALYHTTTRKNSFVGLLRLAKIMTRRLFIVLLRQTSNLY